MGVVTGISVSATRVPVDVELGAPGSALPVGDVRRSGGLELEAQLVASLRYGLGEDTR